MLHLPRMAALLLALSISLAACGTVPAAVPPTTAPTGALASTSVAVVPSATAIPATAIPATAIPATAIPAPAVPAVSPTLAPTNPPPVEELAAWMRLPLTDVRTGQSFTLADFAGQPVYVETMATWCPSCRGQLEQVQQAITTLEGQPPIFIALSVETTLEPEALARYADENGFTPIFAVVSPELLGALAETFGRTITNPPSTPHFIIAPDSSYGELITGASSAEEIVALLTKEG